MRLIKNGMFRPTLEDEVVGQNVREMYDKLLDICAQRVILDGEGLWRSGGNPAGCANNAQLWILGDCLGHASTQETDEDLMVRVKEKLSEAGVKT